MKKHMMLLTCLLGLMLLSGALADTQSDIEDQLSRVEQTGYLQYGPMDRWPAELQVTYDTLCREAGRPLPERSVLPVEGDVPSADAVEAAYRWMSGLLWEDRGLDSYTIGRQLTEDDSGARVWRIVFRPKEVAGAAFTVTLSADSGEVLTASDPADFLAAESAGLQAAGEADHVTRAEEARGAAFFFWPIADKHDYASAQGWDMARYGLPGTEELSAGEAEIIALSRLSSSFNLSPRQIDLLRGGMSYLTGAATLNGRPQYLMTYYQHTGLGETSEDYSFFASVTLDAATGDLVDDTSGRLP